MLPIRVAHGGQESALPELPTPLDLESLVPGRSRWELEIGFGKGRFLLERAASDPETRFVGIEVVSKYYRLVRDRVARRGLDNVLLLRGEALYLVTVALPRGFADVVHVYFPDPWPKDRHHKRRLFEAESLDLVVGALRPGGRLLFATDALDYGELVLDLLEGHGGLEVKDRGAGWPEGPRTHYEAKYLAEKRPIVRLAARLREGAEPGALHPAGRSGVLAAVRGGGGG